MWPFLVFRLKALGGFASFSAVFLLAPSRLSFGKAISFIGPIAKVPVGVNRTIAYVTIDVGSYVK